MVWYYSTKDDELALKFEGLEEIKLDEICYKCRNNSSEYEKNNKESCSVCEGIGYHLTEIGRTILELIDRHKKD